MAKRIVYIEVPDWLPLGCLIPADSEAFARAQGAVVGLVLGQKRYLLLESALRRADSYSVDRVYQAGLELLALVEHHGEALARCGLDRAWRRAFRHNLERLYRMWQGEESARFRADIDRRLEATQLERAHEVVSRFLHYVQAAGLRSWFDSLHSERQGLAGMQRALLEITSKTENPLVRRAILAAGVTEEMLAEMTELGEALHRARFEQARAAAAAAVDTAPLRAAKGVLVAEISRVSALARAELPESRWEPFQVGRLLDLPRPSRREEEPPPKDASPPDSSEAAPAETPPAAPQTLVRTEKNEKKEKKAARTRRLRRR
ncbi:MAG: hypothetical protein RMK29_01590 [Myxococcales bacterium]|nr:hypothetical protein [Myxococcales bacterium]